MVSKRKRLYILYDMRACSGRGTDDAAVLESCYTMAEARRSAPEWGKSPFAACACYSYKVKSTEQCPDGELVDEKWEWNYWPGAGFNRLATSYEAGQLIVEGF